MQRYGKRSEALAKASAAAKSQTVARATYINREGNDTAPEHHDKNSTVFEASIPNQSVDH